MILWWKKAFFKEIFRSKAVKIENGRTKTYKHDFDKMRTTNVRYRAV